MEYTHIYSLSDPNTGEIRYVGKTYNQLRKRLYSVGSYLRQERFILQQHDESYIFIVPNFNKL